MGLPFEPESIEQLKSRFPEALKKTWVCHPDMQDRPTLHRTHVFDFESGMRLGISKDLLSTDRNPIIHVSVSIDTPDTSKFGWQTFDDAIETIQSHYESIGGYGKLRFMGISPNQIPHFEAEVTN
jgi:hypothetical protein